MTELFDIDWTGPAADVKDALVAIWYARHPEVGRDGAYLPDAMAWADETVAKHADDNLRPATPDEEADYIAGHRVIEGAVETEHGLLVPTAGTLTPAERKHIEVYNGYGVAVDWFVGHRRDNGDVEVLAVGHNRDDDEGRGFVWSLLINGDECTTSEAPLGPFATGLEI